MTSFQDMTNGIRRFVCQAGCEKYREEESEPLDQAWQPIVAYVNAEDGYVKLKVYDEAEEVMHFAGTFHPEIARELAQKLTLASFKAEEQTT